MIAFRTLVETSTNTNVSHLVKSFLVVRWKLHKSCHQFKFFHFPTFLELTSRSAFEGEKVFPFYKEAKTKNNNLVFIYLHFNLRLFNAKQRKKTKKSYFCFFSKQNYTSLFVPRRRERVGHDEENFLISASRRVKSFRALACLPLSLPIVCGQAEGKTFFLKLFPAVVVAISVTLTHSY